MLGPHPLSPAITTPCPPVRLVRPDPDAQRLADFIHAANDNAACQLTWQQLQQQMGFLERRLARELSDLERKLSELKARERFKP